MQRHTLQRFLRNAPFVRLPDRRAYSKHIATGNDVADAGYRTKVRADLLEPMGADTLVWTKFVGHELRFRMDGQVKLSEGQEVEIGLSAESLHLFDSMTEDRL